MRRLLSYDPFSGTRQYFEFDPVTEETRIITETDSTPVMAVAQEERQAFRGRKGGNWKGDMHLVARLPMAVFNDLRKKGILGDQKVMRKWLNESDNQVFRTRPGTV